MIARSLLLLVLVFFSSFPPGWGAELLSWQDCLREAKINHPDLISAGEQVRQSEAAKDITASGLFPQVDASAQIFTDKTAGKRTDTYSYGLAGSQLLFDGFKTIDRVKSAAETIRSTQESYRFTSSNVRLNLRTAFINLFRAQELEKVSRQIYDIRRDNLQLITLRYQAGLEHKGALLTAEANLAQAEFDVDSSARDVELSVYQLNKEMGRKGFQPVVVQLSFDITVEKEKPDFEEIADRNPSLTRAAFRKSAAFYDIKSAKADYWPQVFADGDLGKTGADWPARTNFSGVGLTFALPLFEGGIRRAALKQANAVYRQLEADERSTHDGVIVALEQKWQDLGNALQAAQVQSKTLAAAEERARIAEAQYSTGFLSYDNWSIIQDKLVDTKKSHLEARIAALQAQANWIQAKGETLEYVE